MSNVAVHVESDLAVRIARTLLAERDVHIGMFGDSPTGGRVRAVSDLALADVLIADHDDLDSELSSEATERDVTIVSAGPQPEPSDPSRVIVADVANPVHLALAAADHQLQDHREIVHGTAAWTTRGRPLRSGLAATFPEPIGPRWAEEAPPPPAQYPVVGLSAPIDHEYAAASLRIALGTGDGVEDVTFGIVDHRDFLTAALLSAAALAAIDGAYASGVQSPADLSGVFLEHASRTGLVIGRFERS